MAGKKTEEERVIGHILTQTQKWEKKEFSKTEGKASEKAQQIGSLLEKGFKGVSAADKKEFASLFGYVIGEDIPYSNDDKIKLPKMVALVLTGAFDNHTYKLEEVIIHTSGGQAIGSDGKPGNWLEPPKKFVRPATAAEIESIPAKQIKGLFEEADIVIA